MPTSAGIWVSGFAIVVSKSSGSQRHLEIECGIRNWERVEVTVQLLDKQRRSIAKNSESNDVFFKNTLTTPWVERTAQCDPHAKAKSVLVDEPLRRMELQLRISEFDYKRASYVRIRITKADEEVNTTCGPPPSGKSREVICLECNRDAFKRKDTGSGAFFYLVTQDQANGRLEQLLRAFPRLRRQDRATVNALFSLWSRMLSGDSPLLTTTFDDRTRLRKIVYGAIKFARKDVFRERSRSKFQQLEDTNLDDFPSPQSEFELDNLDEAAAKDLETACAHIKEVAGNGKGVELCQRALRGERVSELAKELGLSAGNARSQVSRCRTRLGISRRLRDA